MRWIILHGHESNDVDRNSIYYVQVSNIAYLVKRPENNYTTVVSVDCMPISVKENPEHVFDMIHEEDEIE